MYPADNHLMNSQADNHSAQVIQIESSKLLPMLVIVSGIAISGLVGAGVAWNLAKDARMEARLLENYVQRLDALMVEQGHKKAGDDLQKFRQEQPKE